ncbi:MAG: NmrA family protein [Mucilaginibacter sp.]|nr:NmrA family protein [Mucilaginibacter sp.]
MNIILGASGQVGGAVVANLKEKNEPVKGIIRDTQKAKNIEKQGAAVAVADVFDQPSLTEAFKDGTTLFALIPPNGKSDDILGDTKKTLENYRKAVQTSSIKKIIGLSSMGAQYSSGTGNLLMLHMLEHAFEGLDVKTTFIRPAYYFSNWMIYINVVKEKGILPTFFPVDLAIPMISPLDVGKNAADIITMEDTAGKIYEVKGPILYSSKDVASAFAVAIGKEVTAVQTPRDEWETALHGAGFSKDAIKKFIEMTDAVIEGKLLKGGTTGVTTLTGKTTLQQYILDAVNQAAEV